MRARTFWLCLVFVIVQGGAAWHYLPRLWNSSADHHTAMFFTITTVLCIFYSLFITILEE